MISLQNCKLFVPLLGISEPFVKTVFIIMQEYRCRMGLKTDTNTRRVSGQSIFHKYVAYLSGPPCIAQFPVWPVRLCAR